jgi:hypothetical protein
MSQNINEYTGLPGGSAEAIDVLFNAYHHYAHAAKLNQKLYIDFLKKTAQCIA